jgi:hypothetical protein
VSEAPRVRAVVVNHNGGALIRRSVEALLATDWPAGGLEIVVVDNASTDGSAAGLGALAPTVRVAPSAENLGFAGGSNLGIGDISTVDYIALVNSDAFVQPGWLAPLVAALEADPDAGAASAKLLFEPKFMEVRLRTDEFRPASGDDRRLGLRVSGVRGSGGFGWRSMRFPDGAYGAERGGPDEPEFRWTAPEALLHVPVTGPGTHHVQLRLAAERDKIVEIGAGGRVVPTIVGQAPRWVDVELAGDCFDVVNNAGSIMVEGGHGADRGFGERDRGQYERPDEVFAWCGAAVLLSSRYLADVGLFDGRYFLYYEDFDLSWRARARGWRHLYVPESVVRHVHAATTVENSPLFNHFVQRNRLLTLVKNAPAEMALRECAAYGRQVAHFTNEELAMPFIRRQATRRVYSTPRLRSGAAFLKHFPDALRERRRINARRRVPQRELLEWMVRR